MYAEWVDACDSVAKEDVPDPSSRYTAPRRSTQAKEDEATKSDEDLIDDDDASDMDGKGGYGGGEEGIVADDDEY